jgi:hypothetical protein
VALTALFAMTRCEPDACDDDTCSEEGAAACEDSLVLKCTLVESDEKEDDGTKCRALHWRAVRDCSDEELSCIEGACAGF